VIDLMLMAVEEKMSKPKPPDYEEHQRLLRMLDKMREDKA